MRLSDRTEEDDDYPSPQEKKDMLARVRSRMRLSCMRALDRVHGVWCVYFFLCGIGVV